MDRLISEQEVLDVIASWFESTEQQRILQGRIKAIPSAEPYKGMTNREVIMALFPNPDKIYGYFSFTEEWANAPYTGEE